ncbi:MAG: hypothetical protein SPK97_06210 [Bacteroidales bacterium]|nr:hypothetical protein [Bacteroidales bacterium]
MRWNKLLLTLALLSLFTACMHKSEEDRFIDDLNSRVWFDTDTAEFLFWIAPDSRCQTTPCHFSPCY